MHVLHILYYTCKYMLYHMYIILCSLVCRSKETKVYHCNTGTQNPITWIQLCEYLNIHVHVTFNPTSLIYHVFINWLTYFSTCTWCI